MSGILLLHILYEKGGGARRSEEAVDELLHITILTTEDTPYFRYIIVVSVLVRTGENDKLCIFKRSTTLRYISSACLLCQRDFHKINYSSEPQSSSIVPR